MKANEKITIRLAHQMDSLIFLAFLVLTHRGDHQVILAMHRHLEVILSVVSKTKMEVSATKHTVQVETLSSVKIFLLHLLIC